MKNRKAFITGIKSVILSKKEKIFLKKYNPWGIILFARNLNNINQIKKLTNEIKKLFNDRYYPILIDQEGGKVNRLNRFIETATLTSEYFGKLYKKDKRKFYKFYTVFISQNSYLLNELGINLNTAPVLDVRRFKSNKIIGNRSFSTNVNDVSIIGDFCIKEFHKKKIGTVIKHIPGHGLAKSDSHKLTPTVIEKKEILFKNDFKAFCNKKSLFAMTAHIIYKNIDPINTATHSSKIINLIRNHIGFKNVIMSDDISMKALNYSIKENTLKAFKAGCNLVLHCNGKISEMRIVAENSPIINKFILKKTSQFYKFLR